MDNQGLAVPHMPTIAELHEETATQSPDVEQDDEPINESSQSIHQSIKESTDRLFFVKYVVAGTMRPKWYLVQVDLEATSTLNLEPEATGVYFCVFLAKHPNDAQKTDEFSRFWPD